MSRMVREAAGRSSCGSAALTVSPAYNSSSSHARLIFTTKMPYEIDHQIGEPRRRSRWLRRRSRWLRRRPCACSSVDRCVLPPTHYTANSAPDSSSNHVSSNRVGDLDPRARDPCSRRGQRPEPQRRDRRRHGRLGNGVDGWTRTLRRSGQQKLLQRGRSLRAIGGPRHVHRRRRHDGQRQAYCVAWRGKFP